MPTRIRLRIATLPLAVLMGACSTSPEATVDDGGTTSADDGDDDGDDEDSPDDDDDSASASDETTTQDPSTGDPSGTTVDPSAGEDDSSAGGDDSTGEPPQCTCAGLECGDDGCGNSCGTCESPLECDRGQCVCVPQCATAECGDDGCGGSCGSCGVDELCENGTCVVPGCGPNATGTCVELPPPGWSGPLVVYEGADAPPACPSAYPDSIYTGHGALDCGAHECSPCECSGTPSGGSCSASPDVTLYANDDCTGFFYHFSGATGACYELLGTASGGSGRATIDYATSTSCGAPSGGGVPSIDAPVWGSDALLCGAALEPLGCDATETCAEAAPGPFDAAVCIAADDVQDCPADSSYTTRYVYYSDYEDTRGCTNDCTCFGSGKHCSNIVDLLSFGDTCGDDGQQLPADNVCHVGPYSASGFESIHGSPVDGTGTCNPGGSADTVGTCEANDGVGEGAITVCCRD